VRAAPPEEVIAAGMAIQTDGVFLGNGVRGVLAETNGDGVLAAPGLNVGFAWAVASFASTGLLGSPGMRHHFAHDGVLEAAILILVASYAGLAAYIIAIRG
jgi:hypothetical protein